MKILFCITSLDFGGAQRAAVNLVNEWVTRGNDVKIILTYSNAPSINYKLNPLIKIEALSDLVKKRNKYLPTKINRIIVLRKIACEYEADVVISFMPDANILSLLALIRKKSIKIVSERTFPKYSNYSKYFTILRCVTYPMADLVVLQTSKGAEWQKKNCPLVKTQTIANPIIYPLPVVDPIIHTDFFLNDSDNVIIAVGRLVPLKGFHLLIKAFAKLKQKVNWKLVIAGDGPEKNNLLSLAAGLNLTQNIIFPGLVGNISSWYARADIFVLSSFYEGFPNALLEAMAYGCACVSFDCDTGPGDIIENEVNGLLIPDVGDINALTNKLQLLVENKDLRAAISQEAVKVKNTFAVCKIVDLWDDAINKIKARHPLQS